MATSTIPNPNANVKKGGNVTDASINAYPPGNQYIQIRTESSLGKYLVFFSNAGITLYNDTTGAAVHSIPWAT